MTCEFNGKEKSRRVPSSKWRYLVKYSILFPFTSTKVQRRSLNLLSVRLCHIQVINYLFWRYKIYQRNFFSHKFFLKFGTIYIGFHWMLSVSSVLYILKTSSTDAHKKLSTIVVFFYYYVKIWGVVWLPMRQSSTKSKARNNETSTGPYTVPSLMGKSHTFRFRNQIT